MHYPILCTCGRALDDLSAAFRLLKYKTTQRALRAAGRDIRPENLAMVDDLPIEFGDDLDALGLTAVCCRQKMMGSVKFSDVY